MSPKPYAQFDMPTTGNDMQTTLGFEGGSWMLGVDEVGLGAWAGPLVAGACAWPMDDFARAHLSWKDSHWSTCHQMDHDEQAGRLKDSKQLSPLKRLVHACSLKLLPHGLHFASVHQITQIGLAKAQAQAMRSAARTCIGQLNQLLLGHGHAPRRILWMIDGLRVPPGVGSQDGRSTNHPQDSIESTGQAMCQPSADRTFCAVAAASILAKVTRDTWMHQLEDAEPGYGFNSHVGYGTKAHRRAIDERGLHSEHRRIKPLMHHFNVSQTFKRIDAKVAT